MKKNQFILILKEIPVKAIILKFIRSLTLEEQVMKEKNTMEKDMEKVNLIIQMEVITMVIGIKVKFMDLEHFITKMQKQHIMDGGEMKNLMVLD